MENKLEELIDAPSERGILAGICTYGGDAYIDVADLGVTASTFGIDSNQSIWSCIEHRLKDNPKATVDLPSLLSSAKSLGLSHIFDKTEELQHLRAVMNFPVKLDSVRSLAATVRKLEIARQGHRCLEIAQENIRKLTGRESIDQIIGAAEQPIVDWQTTLACSNSAGPKPVGEGLRAYMEFLAANQCDIIGIPSGFREYDRAIGGGFRPGTVNVVGARPKAGKSTKATNIAIRVSSGSGYEWPKFNLGDAVPVLQLDTEMTREDQSIRQVSMVSGVELEAIETGKYINSAYSRMKVQEAIAKLESFPYEFQSIAGQPFEETLAIMRRWVTKKVGLNDDGTAKRCLIIFDYLKLMDSSSMESRNLAEFQVLGFMMTGLHNFAVRYKLPILCFIQLNRDGINVEDTSAASGSDRIIWLCSNFSIFKKKSEEEIAEQIGRKVRYNRKLVPIVARHGAGLDDGDYINMMLHGSISTIVEGPTRDKLNKGEGEGQPKGIVISDTSDQEPVPFAA